jgi:hypothetical protein
MVLDHFDRKVIDDVGRQVFEHLHGDLILDRFHQSFGP